MHWTFGQKIGAGFAVTVALTIVISAVAVTALRGVVAEKDRVITDNAQILIEAERLQTASEGRVAALRGYLLAREQRSLDSHRAMRSEFGAVFVGRELFGEENIHVFSTNHPSLFWLFIPIPTAFPEKITILCA